ncbi:MAG: hypothetical protein UT02_C0020G0012 [Parcubacteria group bacterium GW2011_GWC2_38_7]|nr:MAG: hypothetical protein UT02_C0020G0012 [Parcubacteria group bacterium GW2011_GWC2_38_7]
MGGALFALMCVLSIAFLVFCHVWMYKAKRGIPRWRFPRVASVARVLSLLLVFGVFGSVTWFEYAFGNVISYDEKGKIVATSRFGLPCVTNCFDLRCESVVPMAITSEVKPITDNPKVRDISYTVNPKIKDDRIFFEAERDCLFKGRVSYSWNDDERTKACLIARVEYYLYEFNNAHSKDLAKFFNPRDPAQVEAFDKLLRDNIEGPLLEHGISISKLTTFGIH